MGGGEEGGWVDRGKRETLIEPIKCRRRSFFLLLGNRWLNRLFYGKHSWNLESNFPIAGRAAFEFEFFPLWKGRISLFLHPSILIIRVVSRENDIYFTFEWFSKRNEIGNSVFVSEIYFSWIGRNWYFFEGDWLSNEIIIGMDFDRLVILQFLKLYMYIVSFYFILKKKKKKESFASIVNCFVRSKRAFESRQQRSLSLSLFPRSAC